MAYEAKNFDSLFGCEGFSDAALQLHFTLYRGYVANTNKLLDTLSALRAEGKNAEPEYAEMERRFGWEFDGMRLHEYFFESMSKTPAPIDHAPQITAAIEKEFGSVQAWEKDFRSIAAMRGIGWGIMYYDLVADRVFNVWVDEHNTGHLVGGALLLPLDVFEHAFLVDYGAKRVDYINAFMQAVNWSTVEKRFIEARQKTD